MIGNIRSFSYANRRTKENRSTDSIVILQAISTRMAATKSRLILVISPTSSRQPSAQRTRTSTESWTYALNAELWKTQQWSCRSVCVWTSCDTEGNTHEENWATCPRAKRLVDEFIQAFRTRHECFRLSAAGNVGTFLPMNRFQARAAMWKT